MQRVTVISNCCCDIENAKNGADVEAQPHLIAIDGMTYELDLSRPNYERLVLPLLDALELYGRRVVAGSTKEQLLAERDIGAVYRHLIRQYRYSQSELGNLTGQSQAEISAIAGGHREILSLEVLERVVAGLGV
ncbi:MAG TPA: hypothetical protein VLJ59_02570 [Mycobacteriales bacterium]|nr:hypothetical protein [Mycobacteriales bacterium]